MKKGQLKFTQPITRVHNVFRIRTVVNAVSKMNLKKKFPGDDEIGLVLARTGLSKFRKEKIKDRIMRRARDHLLTACYMGLLSRVGRPFAYSSTISGKMLQSYKRGEECPKDAMEEAVFIDRIMRLKLTNAYDLQLGKQYTEIRSRPCLYILHILKQKPWLHEHHIAVATGAERCDPILSDKSARNVFSSIASYGAPSRENLSQFYKDFHIKPQDRKNMTRNVRPLLDWCESVGLVESKEVVKTRGRWYNITERGSHVLKMYGEKLPIWFIDLGTFSSAKAAILLFYTYLNLYGLTVGNSFLRHKLKTGLVLSKISDLIQDIEKQMNIAFEDNYARLTTSLDFSWGYDVPPEKREEVRSFLKLLAHTYRMKAEEVIESLERSYIDQLRFYLQKEHIAVRATLTGAFAESTSISEDPILARVKESIPSVGILSQYRSDFEKEAAILLRLLNFNAIKYQGQLADRCRKRHVIRFFENNPDILILNGMECLVECKSTGEWRSPLRTEKGISKEIFIYDQYMPEVKSNSIVLIYEGKIDSKAKKFVDGILQDAKDVVFVTKNYLVNSIHKLVLRERLLRIIRKPKRFKATSRILA